MPIDLYYMPASAPCRAVLLTAHILDVQLNPIVTELAKGQHLTTEFIKVGNVGSKI
ncbi:hypothetical protein L9F63_026939 [Diploptera punctata]|uniref:GST N-terminal domain-containing protein n=1 Tax=Diploptera punctata TaxID=6984 RepID=A0AAD8ADT1_DIPPU|nr:hypothetical protein L9F63_026939 [Diploptera punctata]